MEIRPAVKSDLEALMRIFENAKQIMRSNGNMLQWNDGYPSEAVVLNDICNGHCHVACENGEIIATMALIPGPDQTYTYIEGTWPDDKPYYVIHRLATTAPGKKIASRMFDWAYGYIATKSCHTIRIDTHRDNCIMKHVLTKYGFTECGVIYLESGDPRDAYHYTFLSRASPTFSA